MERGMERTRKRREGGRERSRGLRMAGETSSGVNL